MLDKIAAFFRNLFSGLFGGGSKDTTTTSGTSTNTGSNTSSVPKDLPKAEPDFPQDAPEIDQDTASTVETVSEEEPVFLEPGDDPAEAPVEETPEVTEDPVINAPEIETEPEVDSDPPVVEEPVVEAPVVEEKPKHKPRYMWCLDNGHGKQTAGKRSPKFEDGKQFFEYEFNRDIVKRISERLDEIGIKYFNVVPEVDIDNFLEGRVGRANKLKSSLPKIYLSVHSNAFGRSGWEPPSGIETWYFHTSRSGRALAGVFQKHLINALGWKNRNLKSYPGKKQFYVLRNTSMPAVLTENGFYTNKEECRLLLKSSIRQKIAEAHVTAILELEKKGI